MAFASLKKSSARRSNSTPSRAASAKSSDPTASATAFHDSATAACVCTSADGCAGASHRRILSHPSAHGDARFSARTPALTAAAEASTAVSAYDLCTQSLCDVASRLPRAVAENGLFPTLHSHRGSAVPLAWLYPTCEGSAPPMCSATAATAASSGSRRFQRASPPSQPNGESQALGADCATRTMSGRDTATCVPSMSNGVGCSGSSALTSASRTKTGTSSVSDRVPASCSCDPRVLRRRTSTAFNCAATSALSSQCTLRLATFPSAVSSAGDVPDLVAARNAAASAGSSATDSRCVVTVSFCSGSIKPSSSAVKPSTSNPLPPSPGP